MNTGLPDKLVQSLKEVQGFDEEEFVRVHNNVSEIVSVRFNPLKLKSNFDTVFPSIEKVPWSTYGYYLPTRPSFTLDPLFHAGVYYVQEASGMFIEQCIKQLYDTSHSLRVLDLCAAPGGKSTLLQSLISSDSLLVSNEVIRTRVNILTENVIKWGAANVIVTNNDPKHFSRLENYFDIMLVDAPCSGSGLFRRDPGAITEWSAAAVEMCSLRQQRILADSFSCLKKGGVLIYSTCSYSKEEDEDICDWIVDNFKVRSISLDVPSEWNIVYSKSDIHNADAYRFFPDKVKGEGLFIACFRKEEGEEKPSVRPLKPRLSPLSSADAEIVNRWMKDDWKYKLYKSGEDIFSFPEQLSPDLHVVNGSMYIKKAGVRMGVIMKDELVPDHQLAVSELVNENLVSIVLKKEEALQYLRKEEVTLNPDLKGWVLAQFDNQNLGWMKVLHNRINNYYPKDWRILKSGKN